MKRSRLPLTPELRQAISSARIGAGWSQRQLGERLAPQKRSKDAVVGWESEPRVSSISAYDLMAVARATGADFRRWFEGTPFLAEYLSIEGAAAPAPGAEGPATGTGPPASYGPLSGLSLAELVSALGVVLGELEVRVNADASAGVPSQGDRARMARALAAVKDRAPAAVPAPQQVKQG